MKNPIITHEKTDDTIQLEGKYEYTALTNIGLAEGGDFHIELEFKNLNIEDFKTLARLSKLKRRLQFNSKLIETEKYNITHIVVCKFSANNNLEMKWECLSDDPSLYQDLNLK